MSRRWLGPVVVVALLLAAVGGVAWLNRPARSVAAEQPSAPAGAPVGSCWDVTADAVTAPLPWSGGPVDCSAPHTAELVLVGRADPALVDQAATGDREERRLAEQLMYAQARRACTGFAGRFVGGDWRAARVTVVASWIKPQKYGYFGCAVAETSDPAGKALVRRTATLREQAGALAIGCVDRGTGGDLGYAPCDRPHDGEFTGTYVITPADAPFDAEAVRAEAQRGCAKVGLAYLGLPPDGNRTDVRPAYVGPTSAEAWLGSDQTFACYLMADGKLRAPVKGIGAGPLPR